MKPVPDPEQAADPVDVFVAGTVFLDIVFTGMAAPPTTGHELWTEGMGSSPGGVANLAVSCSRLGLSTSLAAAFGGDVYGDFDCHLNQYTHEYGHLYQHTISD